MRTRGELESLGTTSAADAIHHLRAEIDFNEALAAHRSAASVAECLRAYEVLEDFARASRCSMRACNQLTRRNLERSPSIESECRLFYVGITRARTRCIVSCGASISGIETRSRFLRDAMEVPKPARLR